MGRASGQSVLELLVAFAVVIVLQGVATVLNVDTGLFVLRPPLVERPWTVVTSVYAHAGLDHLLSNAIALVLVGWPVAAATTRLRFHFFFLVCGAIAGVSQIFLSSLLSLVPMLGYAASPGVLGASGGVFALLGYLLASNRLSTRLVTVVDVPRWVGFTVLLVVAGAVTWLTASPRAALIAHFSGLFVGLLSGRLDLLDA